ncbi:MAG: hypothetical protein OEM29_08720 [Thermoplasmata archaeon]|nr:hypothetical protein [Thermoplasmata archaeon]
MKKGHRGGRAYEKRLRGMAVLSARFAKKMLIVGILAGIALLIYGGSTIMAGSGGYAVASLLHWKILAGACSAFILLNLAIYIRYD